MKINLDDSISSVIKEEEVVEGGLADNKTPEDLALKHDVPMELIQVMLQWGIDVEMEHTDDKAMAKEIAMDHLAEDPVYYHTLKEVEEE